MVSITISIPNDIKAMMSEFDEVNWSGFIRKCIIEKTHELSWKEKMLSKLAAEKGFINWSLKLAQHSRQGRAQYLQAKGFLR